MDRYLCKDCGNSFRHCAVNIATNSTLVKKLREFCPKCSSFNIDLTEHGKLLIERQKKIEKINNINSNN